MRIAASLRFSIVVLRLSIVRNASSMPRRICSTVRMPPAIGAASRLITSARPSWRPSSLIAGDYDRSGASGRPLAPRPEEGDQEDREEDPEDRWSWVVA